MCVQILFISQMSLLQGYNKILGFQNSENLGIVDKNLWTCILFSI